MLVVSPAVSLTLFQLPLCIGYLLTLPWCLCCPSYLLQAAADVLALASLEVDISGIEEGQTVTVKWRGKPVFIRHRTAEEIAEAANTDVAGFRDPQTDAERVLDPKVMQGLGFRV